MRWYKWPVWWWLGIVLVTGTVLLFATLLSWGEDHGFLTSAMIAAGAVALGIAVALAISDVRAVQKAENLVQTEGGQNLAEILKQLQGFARSIQALLIALAFFVLAGVIGTGGTVSVTFEQPSPSPSVTATPSPTG
jgi:hypothetical protein